MTILEKLFGDSNQRVVNKLEPIVREINRNEETLKRRADEELRAKMQEFRKTREGGISFDDLLPEVFALVREAARRTIGQWHFDVQLLGGIVLHQGKIAEMKTGEGKTLTATLPLALNALDGKGAHLVTVNDYLAKRDTVWMGPIYHLLGLTVACLQHEQAFIFDPEMQNDPDNKKRSFRVDMNFLRPVTRKEAYQADILYGTNNEFGFDYLRDNMAASLADIVQRALHFAIVDEVDSILVDEARTPLIISSPAEESTEQYYRFAKIVDRLDETTDYNVDEKMRAATLTEEGISKMEKRLGIQNIYEEGGIEIVHHIEQALKAKTLFKRDRDYVVRDGEIIIVDEFTGRLMFGRRYSEGLHQAIEARENVEIKRESETLATITFQNYFRLYRKLAGMTGTAATEAEEFAKIYNLDVITIPTHRPMIRKDHPDRIYKNEDGKFKAIVQEIKQRHEREQPVLVGTISIEKNEFLSQLLQMEGVSHKILNAKQHEQEAAIIAQAGKLGAVTVATNMAGRGVDIMLGGNPPEKEEADKVKTLGGVLVLGTERHESRRIDNQLRGRSGRQGDPGESQFYLSMEDDLMRVFGSERMRGIMERLGIPDDMPIENRLITRSIETAQKKVEGNNFDIRKHLVEFDDIMNKHREVIYKKRREILESEHEPVRTHQEILKMIESEIEQIVSFHTLSEDERSWNIDEIYEVVDTIFPLKIEHRIKMEDIYRRAGDRLQDAHSRTQLIQYLTVLAEESYATLEQRVGDPALMRSIERAFTLRAIDTLWIEHLDMMHHLRVGIGLRGYGQRDPLIEYKKEAFDLFTNLMASIQKQIVYSIYKVGVAKEIASSPMKKRHQILEAPTKTMSSETHPFLKTVPSSVPPNVKPVKGYEKLEIPGGMKKVGRNEPCPCGVKKPDGTPVKYKHCHGK